MILRDNYRAIDLMKKMGFKVEYQSDGTVEATLDLKEEERQVECVESTTLRSTETESDTQEIVAATEQSAKESSEAQRLV
jgi:hypothetical protein